MAIAVGDRVRPKLTSSTLGAGHLNPQPPVLAVVTRIVAGAPNLIIATVADNGITWAINASALMASGVREDALDLVTPPDVLTRQAFMDKVVVGLKEASDPDVPDITVQFSNEYVGEVVDVYVVNGGIARLLIRTANGLYYEMPITHIALVPNR